MCRVPDRRRLFCIVAVVGIGVAVAGLSIAVLRFSAQTERAFRRCSQIHRLVFDWTLKDTLLPNSAGQNAFGNSTSYFRWLFDRGSHSLGDFSTFAAFDAEPYCGTNRSEFLPCNNAFSVVTDLNEDSPGEAPFLLSWNAHIDRLSDVPTHLDPLSSGKRRVVLLTVAGEEHVFDEKEFAAYLRHLQMSNIVLRP